MVIRESKRKGAWCPVIRSSLSELLRESVSRARIHSVGVLASSLTRQRRESVEMDPIEGLEDAGNGVASTFRALKLGSNDPPFHPNESASSGMDNEYSCHFHFSML